MPSYTILETLSVSAFLNPDNFASSFDNQARSDEQYQKGLEVGKNYEVITISFKGVWGAQTPGTLTSYEGIGYHANTAALLRGFLDSGKPVLVYRSGNSVDGFGVWQIEPDRKTITNVTEKYYGKNE